MNTDQVSMLSPEVAATAAFKALNGVQRAGPAEQTAGLALAFRLFCEEQGLDVREELLRSHRFERDCRYRNVNTIDAVRVYVRNELRSGRY